jgi:FkbM family methyltransferase
MLNEGGELMALLLRAKEEVASGRYAQAAQRARGLWRLLSKDTEQLGWHANDAIAEYYVTRLCAPDKVFIDAGAHIGSITGAALRCCPNSRVVAVEAIPEKAERLSYRFPRATVVNCALAETSGPVTFHVDLIDTAWSSLAANERQVRDILVSGQTLNEFGGYGSVDVIKLDLEGAELGALKGGGDLIQRDRPVLMYESGPTEFMGYTKLGMFDLLSAHDYRIFLPARLGKEAPAMTRDVYLDSHQYPFSTLNYFAVPAERVAEISERIAVIPKPSQLRS